MTVNYAHASVSVLNLAEHRGENRKEERQENQALVELLLARVIGRIDIVKL